MCWRQVLLSVFRTFWRGALEVKETGNENATQTPAYHKENSRSFEISIFSRYCCKQTTIQLYFLFCDVKCHHPSQSFKKCHDTHKNTQLCCWNNPGTFFLSKNTLLYFTWKITTNTCVKSPPQCEPWVLWHRWINTCNLQF